MTDTRIYKDNKYLIKYLKHILVRMYGGTYSHDEVKNYCNEVIIRIKETSVNVEELSSVINYLKKYDDYNLFVTEDIINLKYTIYSLDEFMGFLLNNLKQVNDKTNSIILAKIIDLLDNEPKIKQYRLSIINQLSSSRDRISSDKVSNSNRGNLTLDNQLNMIQKILTYIDSDIKIMEQIQTYHITSYINYLSIASNLITILYNHTDYKKDVNNKNIEDLKNLEVMSIELLGYKISNILEDMSMKCLGHTEINVPVDSKLIAIHGVSNMYESTIEIMKWYAYELKPRNDDINKYHYLFIHTTHILVKDILNYEKNKNLIC